jgi:toxin ParE1/3/4
MEVIIAPLARADIKSILAWTEQNFGPIIFERYSALIETAIEQIADNPEIHGSVHRPELAENCRIFHLSQCRKKAGRRGGAKIRKPRHFLLYRVNESGVVEIGRILHDSMDFEQNISDQYRDSG